MLAIKVVSLLRAAVLATNPYWPFKRINRLPYHLAIVAFTHLCGRFKEVNAAYVRHSLVLGEWTPGLSDIDLTIILRDGMSSKEDYSFYDRFFRQYLRMKHLLPMLGEVEVMDERQFRIWQRFGFRGRWAISWRLVFGLECRQITPSVPFVERERELLDEAFGLYEGLYLPKMEEGGNETRGGALRLGGKIVSVLGGPMGTGGLVDEVVSSLDDACRRYIGEDARSEDAMEVKVECDEFHISVKWDGIREYIAYHSGAVKDVICMPLDNCLGPQYYIILEGGITSDVILEVLKSFPYKPRMVLTEGMFQYLLRYNRPLEYFLLRDCGVCAEGGVDDYCLTGPSSRDVYYSVTFNAVRLSVLYRSFVGGPAEFDNIGYVLSFIRAKHYLECMKIEAGNILELAEKWYPQLRGDLKRVFDSGSASQADRFALTRGIVEDVLALVDVNRL